MNTFRTQLTRIDCNTVDTASDLFGDDDDDDLAAVFGGEEADRMGELDWSDSFDDFDSQDWDDYNGTAEYDDDYE